MLAGAGLEEKLAKRAAARKLEDLSIGPVLTWTTKNMLAHVDKLLQIPGRGISVQSPGTKGHSDGGFPAGVFSMFFLVRISQLSVCC